MNTDLPLTTPDSLGWTNPDHTQQSWFQIEMQQALERARHQFMINGRTMTWSQWLDELAPGEHNPMRSYLTLRFAPRP